MHDLRAIDGLHLLLHLVQQVSAVAIARFQQVLFQSLEKVLLPTLVREWGDDRGVMLGESIYIAQCRCGRFLSRMHRLIRGFAGGHRRLEDILVRF